MLSTGCGALVVTSYCVARGQDPFTAMSITFTATIMALVRGAESTHLRHGGGGTWQWGDHTAWLWAGVPLVTLE